MLKDNQKSYNRGGDLERMLYMMAGHTASKGNLRESAPQVQKQMNDSGSKQVLQNFKEYIAS